MKDKIAVIINKARAAQNIFAQYSQEKVDETVTAVAWAICNPKNNKK
jgi:sulfoacetaldehyde dehydrogenase